MKKWIQFFAYALLLGGSTVLGFLGKPTEMGLAIIAAAVALAFTDLERFKRFKGAGFEAELREQVQAIVEKQTEPVSVGEASPPQATKLDPKVKAVMEALDHPLFTWRYFGGVMKDSQQPREVVAQSLQWLVANGFARRSTGKHGTIWSLTESGRIMVILDDFDDLDAGSSA